MAAVTVRDIKKALKFKREPAFNKHLPYSYHVTPTVISTINGEYMTIIKLRGRTHDCASNKDLYWWHRDLNQVLKSVGTENVKFWTHLYHHKSDDYPVTEFKLKFPQIFDASYRKTFEDKPLMVNDLYLTVLYNPVGDAAQKAFSRFDRPTRAELDAMHEEALASLEEIIDQLMGALKSYGPEPLGIYYRDEKGNRIPSPSKALDVEELGLAPDALEVDPDDLLADTIPAEFEVEKVDPEIPSSARAFSDALEWLGFLCNGEWGQVPVCRGRIRDYLMDSRLISSTWGDLIELRSIDGKQYQAGIEIRDYDENTEPGQLNLLMEAEFEFVLSQTFFCMSQAAAGGFLTRQQKALLETKDRSASQTNQLSTAADDVQSRRFVMGWHHATLHTLGTDPKKVQKDARKAQIMFGQCGIKASPVGLASEAAFYARLPGNQSWCPRPAAINSWNFLCFSSFHNFMVGKPTDNPWGPAVALVKTTAGTPLYINWHVSPKEEKSYGKRPPGNTLILGRVGAGKSTILSMLLTESTKFDPRMFCFDKDQGMMPLILSLGGNYTILREGENTGWCPFQMEPTRPNVAMVKRLVRVCAETTNNGPIDQRDVEQLNQAIDHVMVNGLIPLHLRSFTAVLRQIPRPARTGNDEQLMLADLIEPWCRGGEHGWLFDNSSDSLNLKTHDIFGFDVTEFIVPKDQPAPLARTPMLLYLFYRIRQSIDGTRRTIQIFDEFAQYLDDPYMDTEVKRGLKTDRKKDCIYVFATQEPNDALDSRIGKTIMQQCVTKILLENPDAAREDYVIGLKLTEAEYQAMLSIPEHSRQFLYKQGSQSALAVMSLSGMDKELAVLSGTPDNAARLKNIVDAVGNDPAVFLPKYWEAVVR